MRSRQHQHGRPRMPRFYFNIIDGQSYFDEEGTELPDWEAARIEAVKLAGHVMRDEAKRIALGEDWRIEVTDDTGLMLFHITLQVISSPAVRYGVQQGTGAR